MCCNTITTIIITIYRDFPTSWFILKDIFLLKKMREINFFWKQMMYYLGTFIVYQFFRTCFKKRTSKLYNWKKLQKRILCSDFHQIYFILNFVSLYFFPSYILYFLFFVYFSGGFKNIFAQGYFPPCVSMYIGNSNKAW